MPMDFPPSTASSNDGREPKPGSLEVMGNPLD